MIELLAGPPSAARARRLRLAFGTIGRAGKTDVEVPVVSPPWLHLAQPRAVIPRIPAKRRLDRVIHEYALDVRVFRRGLDQRNVRRRPYLRVDVLAVFGNDHGGHHLFPFFSRELMVRHRGEPDIGVETDLMAGMPCEHRAAPRLRHVAEEEPGPAGLGRALG